MPVVHVALRQDGGRSNVDECRRRCSANVETSSCRRRSPNGAISCFRERHVIPQDCDRLQEIIEANHVRLVVVDPFLAYLSAQACSVNDQMVRQALTTWDKSRQRRTRPSP
jgi:hypothetical protein